MVEETEAGLVAVEAVSRAAMVAVPIDPNTPKARVEHIARKVGAPFIISDLTGDDAASAVGLPVLHPLRDGGGTAVPVWQPRGPVGSITFTSGSTGEPKGVMMRPRDYAAMVQRVSRTFGEGAVRVGGVVAGSVPAGMYLVGVFAGCGWTVVPFEVRRQPGQIGPWLMQARVRVLIAVPTVLRQIIGSLERDQVVPDLKFVLVYGETTTWEDVAQLRAHLEPDAMIWNLYAQSEAGSIATMVVGPDTVIGTGRMPVGKPGDGHEVTIVGEDGEPVADGEEGEIVVRSRDTAIGYLDEGPATSKVFFAQPDGYTIVHTRDRGRIGADGLLEHLGRVDHMVKIAGNRVDLGEIESALRAHPMVKDAAATVYTSDNGALRLRAFVVLHPTLVASPKIFRGWLAQRLPRPAVPDTVEVLEQLPMLANGKVDRRSLPAQRPRLHSHREATDGSGNGNDRRNGSGRPAHARRPALLLGDGSPTDRATGSQPVVDIPLPELEGTLVRAWRSALGLEDLEPEDDFFASGGDSLRAVGLMAEISDELGREVPLWLLLEHPTPRSMASALANPQGTTPFVALKGDGQGLPLFLMHDAYGNLFRASQYIEAFDLDQPIFGIRAAAWETTAPERSVEELAKRYANDICQARPRGAFCLVGYSTGSMIAFELGRQLLERNRTVALLVIMWTNATPPKPLGAVAKERLHALKQLPPERVPSEILHVASHAAHGAATRARRWASGRQGRQALSARATEAVAVPLEERAERAHDYYQDLLRSYRPRGKYRGPVLIVTNPWTDKDGLARW
ncbi:MAG TPA: AMP-binding protein, partial [Acidimicrobiales bacterium]|nr:AMP-binding protein [Acidimicrobiales bacterium]